MVHRRTYLTALGTAGASLLAGCSAEELPALPSTDDPDDGEPPDGTDDGNGPEDDQDDPDEDDSDDVAEPTVLIEHVVARSRDRDDELIDVTVAEAGEELLAAITYEIDGADEGTVEVTLRRDGESEAAASASDAVAADDTERGIAIDTADLEGGPYELTVSLTVGDVTTEETIPVTIVGSGAREQEAWRRLQEAIGHLEDALERYREPGDGETILDTDSSVEDFPRTDVVNTARLVHDPLDRAEVQRVSYLADDIESTRLEAEFLVSLARLQDETVKAHDRAREVFDQIRSGNMVQASRNHGRLVDAVAALREDHEALVDRDGEVERSVRADTYVEKLEQLASEIDTIDRYAEASVDLMDGREAADDARSDFRNEEYNLAVGNALSAEEAYQAAIDGLESAPAETLMATTDEMIVFAESELTEMEDLRDRAAAER